MLEHMIQTCSVLNKDEIGQLLAMISRITDRGGPQANAAPGFMGAPADTSALG
jgi:hypothetical protein